MNIFEQICVKNESRKEMENGMDPLQLSPRDTERQALYGRTMAIAVAHALCKINGGNIYVKFN